ncbi:ABC transporter substrate-binding protein [Streptomyces sp. NPDC012888]|uniref:ABC transporter substrate-binding protein n=1 Tax=Streptomyces sp. NPDC012888 TaxID=3364855 RepID=UPI0036A2ADC5
MTRSRRTPTSRALLSAAAAASLLAGCGVLPGDTGGSGETLTVMTWAPEDTKATNMPGMPAMARAYERWANSRGGINGRKLRVLTCNEHNTAGGAADCARRAVAEKAVAVVGSYSQHGHAFMAPLESAHIPYIGGYGIAQEEFQSVLSYPVNGGQPALLAGAGHQLARACRQVTLVRPDTLVGDAMPVLLNAGLKAGRHGEAADIRADENTTDYTSPARDALAHTEQGKAGKGDDKDDRSASCVTAALGGERTETFFDSFRRAVETQKKKPPQISSVQGSVSQALIDRTGGAESPFEGAYVTGWYPVSTDPLWQPMRKVVAEHAFGEDALDPADVGAQTTWIAYTVFTEVVKRLGDERITGSRLARALDSSDGVATAGLTPELRWRYEDMRAVRGYPRLVNGRVTFQVVTAGRLVAQPGEAPMDMTQTMEQAAVAG